ncbi:MAG TPA: ATP-binding protein [Polyangiaceae bacterium]|jgi:PAS domain S-box-containing protein|nr:ATP-binding protein [Polyangiaceae bacterium]
MREVSCKATRMMADVLENEGLSIGEFLHGLPVTVSAVTSPRERIDWDLFVEIVERVTRVLSPEEIGERSAALPTFVLRRIGQLVVGPRQLYDLAFSLVPAALFANVVTDHEWVASGRLVVTCEVLPGYRESPAFLRLVFANVAAAPRVIDLPPAIIEEQTVTGRHGRLVLLPPRSHTLARRVRRRVRTLAAFRKTWHVVEQHQGELEASLAALRTSREELLQLLERLPDGVVIHEGGVIRWCNAAMLEVFGVPDVVGRHILDFVPAEDREALADAMHRAAPNEIPPSPSEYRVARPDGSVRRVQAGATQLVEYHGAKARLVTIRDVTEQHRWRERAAIADRLASIGALAANVAHEINNPLAYVRLNLEMAERRAEGEDPALRKSLALAREGTDHALHIVRDLKLLSRANDDRNEPIDVHALLDSTLALAQGAIASKARLVRRYDPAPFAFGPRARLAQVFLNLLSNASDAIAEGAPSSNVIRATTSTDPMGRAVVEIFDSGCGVPPEIVHRVFDAFFTTKPLGIGTGLGLAICHRIVGELGGELSFESSPGATTFRVALPPAP